MGTGCRSFGGRRFVAAPSFHVAPTKRRPPPNRAMKRAARWSGRLLDIQGTFPCFSFRVFKGRACSPSAPHGGSGSRAFGLCGRADGSANHPYLCNVSDSFASRHHIPSAAHKRGRSRGFGAHPKSSSSSPSSFPSSVPRKPRTTDENDGNL